jgi:hypothetical protein
MLVKLISRARRRLLYNALAAEAIRAATIAVALLIMLLLLGTDILGWRWLVAMPAAALATGASLAIRRLPGRYHTARIVDTRLRLSDTLATALFCSSPESERRFDAGMRQAQNARAEATARTVRASEAVPFRTPRMAYAAVPLALIASSLFVLRYGWQDRLDLHQPIPVVATCLLRLSNLELSAFGKRKLPEARRTPAEQEARKDAAGRAKGEGLRANVTPNNAASQPEEREKGAATSASAKQQSAQQTGAQNSEDRENSSGSADRQMNAAGQQGQQGDANSSLMAKLSDAVRSMLSRFGSQSNANRGGQNARASNASPQGASQAQQRSSGQSGSQQGSQQSAGEAQKAGGRQGQRGPDSAGSGRNGQDSEKQAGSSAGSDNGAKELKQEEQLAAMGKISVILGKRSENLTGNATVEAVSGNQTLVTPYAGARDAHTESNAAIDRDEVPVGLEDYVQRYFVAVRNRTPRN